MGHEVCVDLLEILRAALNNCIFPLSIVSKDWEMKRHKTSSRVGVNSSQVVMKVCVSVLQREIRGSNST